MTTLNLAVVEKDLDSALFDELRTDGQEQGLAVDIETGGLSPRHDRLEVVSLATPERIVVVALDHEVPPHLANLLMDRSVAKVLHHAAFDLGFLAYKWNIDVAPVFCSKVAARLAGIARNPTLRQLVEELLGKRLDKSLQRSDWSRRPLETDQITYAAEDVAHLHDLRRVLARRLHEQGRATIFESCMSFLPTRVELGLLGLDDVFAYSLPPERGQVSEQDGLDRSAG